MFDEELLRHLYGDEKKSMQEIATIFGCSVHAVSYGMAKYRISARTRSEATYVKRNHSGDPFLFKKQKNSRESILFGLGVGLYWGEGNKANLNSVRLGNTDPLIIKRLLIF